MKRKSAILLFLLCLALVLLTACHKQVQPEEAPVEEVYQPTRSVATLAVATKVSACSNNMSFQGDANYEDGTVVAPGTKFLKEWTVYNNGDCDWNDQYRLFFVSGNQMGAPDFVSVPSVKMGELGKISVELTAPTEPGEYKSEWSIFGADNRFFGQTLFVNIVVE